MISVRAIAKRTWDFTLEGMEMGGLVAAAISPIACKAIIKYSGLPKKNILVCYPIFLCSGVIAGGAMGGTIGLIISIGQILRRFR